MRKYRIYNYWRVKSQGNSTTADVLGQSRQSHQRRVKGMYPPEEDPSPLTIGDGITRKPYPISLLTRGENLFASSAVSAQTFP